MIVLNNSVKSDLPQDSNHILRDYLKTKFPHIKPEDKQFIENKIFNNLVIAQFYCNAELLFMWTPNCKFISPAHFEKIVFYGLLPYLKGEKEISECTIQSIKN